MKMEMDENILNYLIEIIEQYGSLFAEPSRVPLSRGWLDHIISLLFGANLVNVGPYRCPLKQRDIIE